MKIFKFGGASVSTTNRLQKVGDILKSLESEPLVIVISAMGKTTNALEKVVDAFFSGNKENALELFNKIKEEHIHITKSLDNDPTLLNDFFTEVEWLLHDKPVREYDYYYDQIVCAGELLSTSIVSHYLNNNGIANHWLDVRDIIRTDNNFRNAQIQWDVTSQRTEENIKSLLTNTSFILTQGFIGATDENESTTLGREGSDYTAAVFANLLNAESLTIWKDVEGVMNADPKAYKKAEWIPELNYKEVIEMAYYGAQVIHPKTIKPLENKNIPLYVKSFINPGNTGTVIHNKPVHHLPPIIVYKYNQVLVELYSKDFSFVGEGLNAEFYRIFDKIKFKPNLTQNAAISMLCVVDEHSEKVDQLAHEASLFFDVQLSRQLTLLTIRHFNDEIVKELIKDHRIILQQQTPETLQVLIAKT
jgi:aspartate kinase